MGKCYFPSLIEFSHSSIQECLLHCIPSYNAKYAKTEKHVLIIDGTCGNGHDTLFLCNSLQPFIASKEIPVRILTFDIQEQALNNTKKLLEDSLSPETIDLVALIHQGHEEVENYITTSTDVAVGMYNLGFLPGSNKEIVTKENTTIASLECVAKSLIPKGLISVHSYGGHKGGLQELSAVNEWFSTLSDKEWTVAKYSYCNKNRHPESLYLAEKIK